jgi:hypothetical protein
MRGYPTIWDAIVPWSAEQRAAGDEEEEDERRSVDDISPSINNATLPLNNRLVEIEII